MSRLLPISFTAPLALAVLEGRKTETRRPIVGGFGPPMAGGYLQEGRRLFYTGRDGRAMPCLPGDRLYVREPAVCVGPWHSTTANGNHSGGVKVWYVCDGVERLVPLPDRIKTPTPGHGLPNGCYREASRMTLPVLSVHPERLQDITEADALAEGFDPAPVHGKWVIASREDGGHWSARKPFAAAWDTIYAKRGHGWDANPWVWVIRWGAVEVTP